MPPHRGIKRCCCLTPVAYIRLAGGMCGGPAGWHVLADQAWFGRCSLLLQAWAGAYRVSGGPAACFSLQLLYEIIASVRHLSTL